MELMTFSKDWVVPQTDCDLQNRMTLGALLRCTQQIATDHCDAIGMPGSYLLEHGAVFLLAKVGVELSRPIRLGEALRVVTRPCAPRHVFYNRYTTFYAADGSPAAQVDARWVLVNPETRRVLRRPPEGLVFPFAEWIDEEQDLTITRAAELTEAGHAAAVYSRVDVNGHLNNTYYGDILCDTLPTELWQQQGGFCKAILYYRSELPLGCRMSLFCGETEYEGRSCWYVEGVRDGARCFEGNLFFSE